MRAVTAGVPLPGAEILIENLGLRAMTNDKGYFRLPDIPLGRHDLRIRRIGFTSAIATLRVETADSLVLDFAMEAWVPELEPLFVKGITKRSARLADFYDRKKTGIGTYLEPRDVREGEKQGWGLAELLRERGVEIQTLPNGAGKVAVGRASPSLTNRTNTCYMRLLLDGVDLSNLDLTFYPVTMLGAVEIYRHPVSAPIEFTPTGAVCGLILMWTRDS